ncbi:hypothetical protein LTR08_008009 [Meristemomyces frigidus]|nr:hypothetical protein LTR08_008009 [Meristemomyces frigidus]
MSSPGRKRSRDDDQDDHDKVENSATAMGEDELHASQIKPSNSQVASSTTPMSAIPTKDMAPPPVPASSMPPPALQPPPSGQGALKSQAPRSQPQTQQPKKQPQRLHAPSSDKARETPTTSVQKRTNSDDTVADESEAESEGATTPSEPQITIARFDWNDLQQRYHDKMRELDLKEQDVYEEFETLCAYFSVWANTSQTHEVDRSFKRLKTQTTFVRHEEDELERKRSHYIKVVEAFKSALQLLGN